jgi:GPH family glycoside/pentoside/hexuronide:cation symporter
MAGAFATTGSARSTARTATTLSGPASLKLVLTNRPFVTLLMAKTLQLFGLAAVSAAMLFFIKSVIGGTESTLAIWGLANSVASIVSMPLWLKIARRLGKRNTYILSILLFCANGFTWLLAGPGEPMSLILARAIAGGLFSAGLLLMGQSILPDTIEYDHYRSGQRREGVYAGAYGFVEKASTALGPLVIGVLLQALGFSPKAATQTHDGTLAVYLAVAVVPAGAYLISVIPLLFYNLTEARLSELQSADTAAKASP